MGKKQAVGDTKTATSLSTTGEKCKSKWKNGRNGNVNHFVSTRKDSKALDLDEEGAQKGEEAVEDFGEVEGEEEANRSNKLEESTKGSEKDQSTKKKKSEKNKRVKEDVDERSLYRFPMNRVIRMVKSEDPSVRMSQEAVFLINGASEKFLQLFCEEAYDCLTVDHKKCVSYKHLSSVVSKRRRFDFISDFVPEKVKAQDVLKELPSAKLS